MSATAVGPLDWTLDKNQQGRTYKLKWLVKADDYDDGPQTAMNASGLASIGAPWGYGNDDDPWALCLPIASSRPFYTNEKGIFWIVEQTFSTAPIRRCQDTEVEDPLQEPPNISGSYTRYVKEAQKDRNGAPIYNSSKELITGIEKDAGRPTVVIELNSLTLGLDVATEMQDTLNDAPLWDLSERKIKLTMPSWQRKIYGSCTFYYTRRFEFEIRFEGFDRDDIVDAGNKVFRGSPFSLDNPDNYIQYKDVNGENSRVLLDGNGNPLTDINSPVYLPTIELYDESNFLTLGIPSSIG